MAQTLGPKFKLVKGPFELIGSYGTKGDNDIYFATDKGIIKANGEMIGAHAVVDASILAGTNTLQINFVDGTDTSVDLSGINLAQTLKDELIGHSDDASNANTIYGVKNFAKAYADASINGLDVADISADGQAIIAVGETDGKIHATAGDIAAAHVTIADEGGNFTASTVEAALAELADGAATYSFTKVPDASLTADVKEAWQLVETKNGSSSDVAGSLIKIYKDSALLGAKVSKSGIQWTNGAWGPDPASGNDVLALAYENKNGVAQVVEIDVANFLRESEFKDGLQVNSTNGEVSVKIDPTSETAFLTVSSNGVKLAGVQTAINNAKDELIGNDGDSLVGNPSALTLKSLKNKVLNLDGTDVKIATGYAKADSATGVAANDTVNVAFGKVEKQIDSLGADAVKTVTVNGQNADVSNNNASVTIDGADIALDGYAKASAEAAIAATDTVNGALGKLEYKTDANKAAIVLLNGPDTSTGSVAKSIKDAIEGLDVSDTSVANQYVAEVSETDGKIHVERAAIPVVGVEDASVASQVAINAKLDANSKVSTDKANLTSITLGGYSTTGVTAADVEATDTLGTAIAKIEAMLSWTVVTADANPGA